MRCHICNIKFKPVYFLQKNCGSDECKTEYNKQNKPKRINQVSKKRSKQNAEYLKEREKFMSKNPLCQICKKKSTEVHHIEKRNGERLTNVSNFMAVCRSCHLDIHLNPIESRKKGFLK